MLAQARLPGMRVHGRFRPANYVPCLPRGHASRLNIGSLRLLSPLQVKGPTSVLCRHREGRQTDRRARVVDCGLPKYGQSYVPVPGTNKHKSARQPRKVLE
jgi:hypothetical protein